MPHTLRKYLLLGDKEVSNTTSPHALVRTLRSGTEIILAADVDALLAEQQAEMGRLKAKLECNRCNKGHETLPLILWDCPTCHDETRAERDTLQAELARCREALQVAKDRLIGHGGVVAAIDEANIQPSRGEQDE